MKQGTVNYDKTCVKYNENYCYWQLANIIHIFLGQPVKKGDKAHSAAFFLVQFGRVIQYIFGKIRMS